MDELTAADIMAREVVTVSPDTSIREVAELLVQRGISGVPVVDGDGRVLGIISETDLIDENKRNARIPRVALFGFFPVPEDTLRTAFEEGDRLTAADIMTRRVVSLPEDASARQVAQEMVTRHVNRIPVTRDGRLVGIITRHDVLQAIEAHWRKQP